MRPCPWLHKGRICRRCFRPHQRAHERASWVQASSVPATMQAHLWAKLPPHSTVCRRAPEPAQHKFLSMQFISSALPPAAVLQGLALGYTASAPFHGMAASLPAEPPRRPPTRRRDCHAAGRAAQDPHHQRRVLGALTSYETAAAARAAPAVAVLASYVRLAASQQPSTDSQVWPVLQRCRSFCAPLMPPTRLLRKMLR